MNTNHLPDYDVVVSAINGDLSSMRTLIHFYASYIETLATEELYDEQGNVVYRKDQESVQELQLKLIMCTLRFKIK